MGSSYFRHPKMENDGKVEEGGSLRGGRGSRRGKKSSFDKPKQPQRGLGVAQLEKIRLNGQSGVTNFHHPCLLNPYPSSLYKDDIRAQAAAAATYAPFTSSSFSYDSPPSSSSAASYGCYNPHFLIANNYERAGIKYDDVQPTNCPSWIPVNPSNVAEFPHHVMRPMSPTINILNFSLEADSPQVSNKSDRGISNSRNSEDQELDLELRLSR